MNRDIGLVITAYLLYKLVKRTKIIPLNDIPVQEALAMADQDLEVVEQKATWWRKVAGILLD